MAQTSKILTLLDKKNALKLLIKLLLFIIDKIKTLNLCNDEWMTQTGKIFTLPDKVFVSHYQILLLLTKKPPKSKQ